MDRSALLRIAAIYAVLATFASGAPVKPGTSANSKPASAKTEPKKETPPPAEKKSGMFSWLLGDDQEKSEAKDTPPADPKATPAKSSAKTTPAKQEKKTAEPEEKSGMFSWLLGKDEKDEAKKKEDAKSTPAANAKTESKKPATNATAAAQKASAADRKQSTDPKTAAKKTEIKPEAAPKEEKGFFSRLFSDDDEKKETPDAKDPKKSKNEKTAKDDQKTASADGNASVNDGKPVRPDDWEKKSIITEDEVPAYRFGPSQATGADEFLTKGTLVEVVKRDSSCAQIKLADGRIFIVYADQLRKAAKDDFADPPSKVAAVGGVDGAAPYFDPGPPPNLPDLAPSTDPNAPQLLLPPLPE